MLKFKSDISKSLLEIVENIIYILKTNRETDHTAVDTAGNKLFVSKLTVSSACRVENAGTDISNVNLIGSQLQRIHKLDSSISAALDNE